MVRRLGLGVLGIVRYLSFVYSLGSMVDYGGDANEINGKKVIRSFRDLEVYQNTYKVCIIIHKQILSKLPPNENFDLCDQTSRSSKAIPRLIAEGYAKRHQKAGFQKYIDDSMSECNETIVSLEQIRDIYSIEVELCND